MSAAPPLWGPPCLWHLLVITEDLFKPAPCDCVFYGNRWSKCQCWHGAIAKTLWEINRSWNRSVWTTLQNVLADPQLYKHSSGKLSLSTGSSLDLVWNVQVGFKVISHLATTYTFVFSKIIEAIVITCIGKHHQRHNVEIWHKRTRKR